jgi:hypothetical protein
MDCAIVWILKVDGVGRLEVGGWRSECGAIYPPHYVPSSRNILGYCAHPRLLRTSLVIMHILSYYAHFQLLRTSLVIAHILGCRKLLPYFRV